MNPFEHASTSILVTDDSEMNRQMLSGILAGRGYSVTMAKDGAEAVDMARERHFDLIMLDINMPVMDGYEACVALKADDKSRGTPVIFISALDDAMDKVQAFDVGAADYIVKPFQSREVIARVENQLRLAHMQREMAAKNVELTRKNEEILRATEEIVTSCDEMTLAFSTLSSVLPGQVLDEKYRLESLIGEGGYGAVYRASHINLDRSVAIKVLRPNAAASPDDLRRFRREGVFTCRVNHPSAITVWDAGVTKEGIAYLVMELLSGRTLRAELYEKKKLSLERCAEILGPVCDVLAVAHATGVVHRDIKPDNVFLHQSHPSEVVKVVDFGIAALARDRASLTSRFATHGGLIGTPLYIAPERFEKNISGASSDVYSVGVMLYEMLCGVVPFSAPRDFPWAVADLHLNAAPEPPRHIEPSIPPLAESLILRALSKDPASRPTAAELSWKLCQIASSEVGALHTFNP